METVSQRNLNGRANHVEIEFNVTVTEIRSLDNSTYTLPVSISLEMQRSIRRVEVEQFSSFQDVSREYNAC